MGGEGWETSMGTGTTQRGLYKTDEPGVKVVRGGTRVFTEAAGKRTRHGPMGTRRWRLTAIGSNPPKV